MLKGHLPRVIYHGDNLSIRRLPRYSSHLEDRVGQVPTAVGSAPSLVTATSGQNTGCRVECVGLSMEGSGCESTRRD